MKKEKSEEYWIIFLTNSTKAKKTMGNNIMIEGEPEEGGKNNDSKENRLKRKR